MLVASLGGSLIWISEKWAQLQVAAKIVEHVDPLVVELPNGKIKYYRKARRMVVESNVFLIIRCQFTWSISESGIKRMVVQGRPVRCLMAWLHKNFDNKHLSRDYCIELMPVDISFAEMEAGRLRFIQHGGIIAAAILVDAEQPQRVSGDIEPGYVGI